MCVAALILDAIISMWKKGVKDGLGIALFGVILLLSVFTGISPILLVVGSAVVGVAARYLQRKKLTGGDAK